ncbi:MAG: CpaF family protein [Acidimicrobiia bacterium]|nr:CpaF family protein [Acidimicrobiia bacterium]
MGPAVAVIDRLVERVLHGDVPLERVAVERAVGTLLADEAPLAAPGVAVAVADALVGLGPLEPLLADTSISDILVNADGSVWIERRGSLDACPIRFVGAGQVIAAVERVIAPLGLRLDRASPAVDARLPDGSRLHAIIPPASVDGPVVAIRRFTAAVPDLDALVAAGSTDEEAARLLRTAVQERRNLLVSGGTGSGKTTLLNILAGEVPNGERVVVIEDSAEIQAAGHMVRLEARPPNAEGAGEITLRTLVRHALRLRPDRIIIGEVRGAEALDMIQAINTGHAGSMSTVHANGPDEAMWRLETLAMSGRGGLAAETIRRQLWGALDIIVQLERSQGHRRIVSISEVADGALLVRWTS